MKKITLLILSCLFMSICFAQDKDIITPELQKILNQKNDELIDINIFFKSKMPAEHLQSLNVKSDSRSIHREVVVNELKRFSVQSQESVMSVINAEARNNNIVDIKSHWLVNYINCKASRDVIYQLAQHPDIEYIDHNSELELSLEGVQGSRSSGDQGSRSSGDMVTDNISHVQADKVWDLGYTGKGVIVAVLDSGINTDHIDLKDHLWYDEGASYPGHNFVFTSEPPTDDQGHGTHCSGTVCGDGTSGLTTGMAPDATLMPLKVTNRSTGVGAGLDRMVSAVEYAVENKADIISISIGFWSPSAYIKEAFRDLFTNTLQAGVVVAQAAGNNRGDLGAYPAPNNINTPGDCPPPWFHPDQTTQVAGTNTSVICVGAVDENNVIAGVSSQGPVTWTNTSYGDYPYNPGMGLIRPDIVAPGASVKSLDYESNDGYLIKAGTSMAAPCVAGVMALMLEKNPDLTPADLCRIIETTATKLTTTKSNDYGSGCINALAAVQSIDFNVNAPYISKYHFTKNITPGINQNIELTLINNGKISTNGTTNVSITTNDNNVTIVNGNATYAAMNPNATATGNFTIKVSELVEDNYKAILNVNATNGGNSWIFEIEINISNPLLPPSRVTANVSGKTISLSWDETNNATSYNIYRNSIYIANTTELSYTDESLEYGTLYEYTITSKRVELESEHSVVTRAQTEDNPEKPSPTNVTAKENNNNINVTWNNGNNSKSANVYRLKDGSEETTLVSNIDTDTYTDNEWSSLSDGFYQYGVSNNYAVDEVIYEEGFEEISLSTTYSSTDWYTSANWSGNNKLWSFTTSTPDNFGGFARYLGEKAAFINNIVTNANNTSYLVTPQFDFSEHNGSTLKLSFYYITPVWKGYPNDINTLQVKISTTSNNDGWIDLWSSNKTDISEWTKAEIDLSAYANGSFYIAFVNVPGGGYCTGVDEMKFSIGSNSESRIEWSDKIYKNINVFCQDGLWTNTDNWATNQLPTENDLNITIDANAIIENSEITVNSLTINEGKTLTLNNGAKLIVKNEFNNSNHDALIINDGAQVVHNSENLLATFNMDIVNPQDWSTNNTTGWQFIASPVKNAKITDFIPQSSDYDLYKYDGSKKLQWVNYKDENEYEGKSAPRDNSRSKFESTFQQGVGYLASYEEETSAAFRGNLNHEKSYDFPVTYSSDKYLANFHLLGNPFSFNMKWNNVTTSNLATGYAIVNEQGGYTYFTDGEIKVGDGFFVKVTDENPSFSYNEERRNRDTENKNINIIASGKTGSDNLIINLTDMNDEGFDKLQNFNDKIANIYVVENNKRYGIYNYKNDVKEVELCFEAKEIGSYTIKALPNGKFETIVLVDTHNNVETNLQTDDYTFTATSRGNTNRFILRLAVSHKPSAVNNFVYQSGRELIINEKGSIQIIDLMGRIVYDNEIVNEDERINIIDFKAGAYIVRLINDKDVMTQKVVVY